MAVPTAVALGCALLLWRVVRTTGLQVAQGVPLEPAAALVGALSVVGLAGLGWLLLGVLLETLALAPGALGRAASGASAALSPRVVRRAAALVLGAGLGAGLGTGSAQAAPQRATAVVTQVAAVVAGVPASPGADLPDPGWRPAPEPGWVPEAPAVRPQPDLAALGARSRPARDGCVVVRRGDSLWGIAARHLGEGASDAEVAAQWPRWYAANRDVVGPDPDVLRPGQVLRAPGAASVPGAAAS